MGENEVLTHGRRASICQEERKNNKGRGAARQGVLGGDRAQGKVGEVLSGQAREDGTGGTGLTLKVRVYAVVGHGARCHGAGPSRSGRRFRRGLAWCLRL